MASTCVRAQVAGGLQDVPDGAGRLLPGPAEDPRRAARRFEERTRRLRFRKYSYLLKEEVTGRACRVLTRLPMPDFDPTDLEACRERLGPFSCATPMSSGINAYRRAKYEVQVLSESLVDCWDQ